MQPGDLVQLYWRNSWGGIRARPHKGVLLKMSYTAYDPKLCRWHVLVDGSVETVKAFNLKVLERVGPPIYEASAY